MYVYNEYNRSISYDKLVFSGGEVQVKITNSPLDSKLITIEAKLKSSEDIMELCLLSDALRRQYPGSKLRLVCPYLPYARQDRVCYPGEALSLKVMCNIINSLDFEKVVIWDVHSDVSLALLNNVENIPQSLFYSRVVRTLKIEPILVSPDAGAVKKTLATAKMYSLSMVRADKNRNPANGEITGTTVYSEHVGHRDFLVMDDICDGGRTFNELGRVLNSLTTGKLYLYVTHGIFSKGLEELLGYYNGIFTANSWINDPRLYTI